MKGYDPICLGIVNRETKSTLFLSFKTRTTFAKLAEMCIDEIVKRHGAPVSAESDRDYRLLRVAYNDRYQASKKCLTQLYTTG